MRKVGEFSIEIVFLHTLESYLLILQLFLPLLGFVLLFEAARFKVYVGYIASVLALCNVTVSILLMFQEDVTCVFHWFPIGDSFFTVVLRTDPIAKSMCLLINFIAFLVILYSVVYMKGEKHYHKYFAYLGLFTFSMLGIVLFDNLLFIYAFWEMVGLSSYLLIGFWYQNPLATMASKKAFIINRIGDIGFLVGILMIWTRYGTLDLQQWLQAAHFMDFTDTFIGVSLFGGCIGKSAQFPLQVWLPDAMYGPTPASALIHAATMVAAGIYFMIRVLPFCTPDALLLIGAVGGVTAVMAALSACVQYDIKKILAYSTISQLGLMVVAISTGRGEVAYLHLFTHAFFKAGLFLCAGAIIHEIAHHSIKVNGKDIDPQDIRLMGGLGKKMKVTYVAYILCYVSAIGLPLTSGFISKDFIISNLIQRCLSEGGVSTYVILCLTTLTVLLTSYYMTRQLILVFWGTYRVQNTRVDFHEASKTMLVPMLILGLFGLFIFFSLNPFDAHHAYLLQYIHMGDVVLSSQAHTMAAVVSIILAAIGVGGAYVQFYKKSFSGQQLRTLSALLYYHFYINRLYMRVVMPASLVLSKRLHKFDVKAIDGVIDQFGVLNVITAHVTKVIDQYGVDSCYHLIKSVGVWIGGLGNGFQHRRIQDYLKLTVILVLVILAYMVFF